MGSLPLDSTSASRILTARLVSHTPGGVMGHHPSIAHLLQYFRYDHLPERLQAISKPFHDMAHELAQTISQNPELTVGLRKLLEAKDCVVRASLG